MKKDKKKVTNKPKKIIKTEQRIAENDLPFKKNDKKSPIIVFAESLGDGKLVEKIKCILLGKLNAEEPKFKIGDIVGLKGKGFKRFKIIEIKEWFSSEVLQFVLCDKDTSMFYKDGKHEVNTFTVSECQIFPIKELELISAKEKAFITLIDDLAIKTKSLEKQLEWHLFGIKLAFATIITLAVMFTIY